MGLSDRGDRLYTLEERVDDIRAVLDAAESQRTYLMGFSEGGAMAGFFAATYPDRAEGLILYGAPPAYRRRPDWPSGETDEQFEARWHAVLEEGYQDDLTTPPWRRWLGPTLPRARPSSSGFGVCVAPWAHRVPSTHCSG
jgi:pimeloyl-ACP methyl ester carboxylesterase